MSGDEGLGSDRPSVATPDITDLDDLTLIGRGGFCRVYAALDVEFGRRVAVKVFPPQDDEGLRRIERERLLMGRMSMHPNVVTPHRYGETESGLGYLVMEYLPGGSLDQMVARTGPVQWPRAVELVGPILDALEAAHDLGIVHRDIKPANILLTAEGETKLADFGIAQIRPTTDGDTAFSLAYCAPEAFEDGTDRRDERSDLYSLAATLFHLVTGRAPFEADGDDSIPAYLRRVELNAVPPVGSIALDDFFRRALAKNPADRPQNPAEFRASMLAAGGLPTGPVTVTEVPAAGAAVDLDPDPVAEGEAEGEAEVEAQAEVEVEVGTEVEVGVGADEPRPILAESEPVDPIAPPAETGATVPPAGGLPSVIRASEGERTGRRLRLAVVGVAAAAIAATLVLGFALGPSFWPGTDDESASEDGANDGGDDEAAGPTSSVSGSAPESSISTGSTGTSAPAASIEAESSDSTSSTGSSTGRSSTTGPSAASTTPSSTGASTDQPSTSSSTTTTSRSITTATVRSSTTGSSSSSSVTTARPSTTRPSTTRLVTTGSTARPTTTVDRADEAFQAGVVAFNAGRIDESIGHLDRAAALDPDHPEVFIYRSLAHRVSGRFGQAVADGDRAVDNAPNNGDAYLQRGIALAADGRPTAALADLNRADRLKPRSTVVLLNRGVVNADLGNLAQARADLTEVISIDPSNADAYWHRGRVNGRAGRNDQALADLETFVRLAAPSDGRLPEARRLIAELRDGTDPFDQV